MPDDPSPFDYLEQLDTTLIALRNLAFIMNLSDDQLAQRLRLVVELTGPNDAIINTAVSIPLTIFPGGLAVVLAEIERQYAELARQHAEIALTHDQTVTSSRIAVEANTKAASNDGVS